MRFIHTAAIVAVALATIAATAVPASADPVDDFYTLPVPAEVSSAGPTGTVVRTQPMPLLLAVPGADLAYPTTAQRVMFTSRTEDDAPTVVTGTFIDANRPWTGAGPRPTIVVAPGTVGQGDQCAPSRAFPTGLFGSLSPASLSANQELASSTLWGSMGARVFVTDYIGLGTPGVHTYVNRLEQAHAVLDAARAAGAVSGQPEAPIGLWGYSQGGGAVAAAAELAPSYAPELNIVGTWAGGPTADLLAVLGAVDGTLIGGVVGYALNGFVDRNPQLRAAVDAKVNERGRALLDAVSTECIADTIVLHPFLRSTSVTADGRSMLENLRDVPEAEPILDAQRIGRLTPSAPVLITSGLNDDTVPYGQARTLATDWCDRGADVTFTTNQLPPVLTGAVIPNHFGPQIIDGYGGQAARFLMDRFAGVPTSGCSIT